MKAEHTNVEPKLRRPLMVRVIRFLLLAPLIGGLIGGLIGVAIVVVGSANNPNDFMRDPGGWSVIFAIVWGGLGAAVGLVVGLIGAVAIAISR